MRCWSLHPLHLDTQGLLAVWREALLAKYVLEGKTRGYKHHPQLIRFRESPDPLVSIHYYLSVIHAEAERRGYHFDGSKFNRVDPPIQIPVTSGQLNYEWQHLLLKLQQRSPESYEIQIAKSKYSVHPLFVRVEGSVEVWERLKIGS